MNHLPYILGSYGAFGVIATWLSTGAMLRLRRSAARLRAVDTRKGST